MGALLHPIEIRVCSFRNFPFSALRWGRCGLHQLAWVHRRIQVLNRLGPVRALGVQSESWVQSGEFSGTRVQGYGFGQSIAGLAGDCALLFI